MSAVWFVTLALFSLVASTERKKAVQNRGETEQADSFWKNVHNTSSSLRHVPSYLKKLYKMQDRRSTISQVSCIFSELGE